jgi:hypothetical protein
MAALAAALLAYARRRSVLVRAESVRGRAGVADRGGRIEVAERDRHTAVGEQAFDVIDAVRPGIDLDQAAERAAPDPLRGEPVCLRVGIDNGQWQRQGHRVDLGLGVRALPPRGRAA